MENTCIKILSLEHSEKVVEYYKSLGIDTEDLIGGCVGKYMGVFGGVFGLTSYPGTSKLIELPKHIFEVGDFVYVNIGCPLVVRYIGKENIIVENLLQDETTLFNFDTNLFLILKKYSDYIPKQTPVKSKIIDKIILCYYVDVRKINNCDIEKYIYDIIKMFGEKDDDSVIQYFIPVQSETRIECIYKPNDKELKDLTEKVEELNNYIKNNK